MRADIGFFRMEQIIQKLFHLADIEAVAGFDSTVAGQIGQGAMTDHGFIRFLLVVQEQADIFQGIRNGMRAVNMSMLLEAAEMLGASKLYAFFRVVVPNIISAVVVSSLLAVGIIFGDYVLVRNLAGTSFQNMQIYLYQTMKSDSVKASAVFVVIMLVTCIIAGVVLTLQNRGKKPDKS